MGARAEEGELVEDGHVLDRRHRLDHEARAFEQCGELAAGQVHLVKGGACRLAAPARAPVGQPVGQTGLDVVGAEGRAHPPARFEHAKGFRHGGVQPVLQIVVEPVGKHVTEAAVRVLQPGDVASFDLERSIGFTQLVHRDIDVIDAGDVVTPLVEIAQDAPGPAAGLENGAVAGRHGLEPVLQRVHALVGHRAVGRNVGPAGGPVVLHAAASVGDTHL